MERIGSIVIFYGKAFFGLGRATELKGNIL